MFRLAAILLCTVSGFSLAHDEPKKIKTDLCKIEITFSKQKRDKGTLALCKTPIGKGRKTYYSFYLDRGYWVTPDEYEFLKNNYRDKTSGSVK